MEISEFFSCPLAIQIDMLEKTGDAGVCQHVLVENFTGCADGGFATQLFAEGRYGGSFADPFGPVGVKKWYFKYLF